MEKNVTIHVSGSIGTFRKDSPQIGDAGHCHRQEPLHQHQGLLLCGYFLGKYYCTLKITGRNQLNLQQQTQTGHL